MKHFLTVLVALTLLFCAGNAFSQTKGEKYVLDSNGNMVIYTPKAKKKKKNKKQSNDSVKQQKQNNQIQNNRHNNKPNSQRQNNVAADGQVYKTKESPTLNTAKQMLEASQGAVASGSAVDARKKASMEAQNNANGNGPLPKPKNDAWGNINAQQNNGGNLKEQIDQKTQEKMKKNWEQFQKQDAADKERQEREKQYIQQLMMEQQKKSEEQAQQEQTAANIREQQEKGTHHDAIFRSENVSYEGSDDEVPAEVRAIAEAGRLNGRRIVVRKGETPAQARMRARLEQVQGRTPMTGEEANKARIQARNAKAQGKNNQTAQTEGAANPALTLQQKALSNLAGQVAEKSAKQNKFGRGSVSSTLEQAHKIAANCKHLTDFDECDTCCGKGTIPDITSIAIIDGHCACLTSDYQIKYTSYSE